MNYGLYSFEMPILRDDLSLVEDKVRKSGVITLFDPSTEAASILNYRIQKVEYGTQTNALLDLNVFKDILSLAREDSSRKVDQKRETAALCLFFICANIDLEPCMALHENPSDCAAELKLFRQIENVDPEIFLEIMHGNQDAIPGNLLPQASADDVTPEELDIELHGSLMIEIALLKLADVLRSKEPNDNKMMRFLRWCHDDFIFVREVLHLAVCQLVGNQPKPVLKEISSSSIEKRLAGVENAKRDMLLIREWRKRLDRQAKEPSLWLLCSRDFTASNLARDLVVVCDDEDSPIRHLECLLVRYWGKTKGKRILGLYNDLMATMESSCRKSNCWDYPADLYLIRDKLKAHFIQDLNP